MKEMPTCLTQGSQIAINALFESAKALTNFSWDMIHEIFLLAAARDSWLFPSLCYGELGACQYERNKFSSFFGNFGNMTI